METQKRITKPGYQVNTTIDPKLWELAKEFNIGWQSALEFGINFKLAERDFLEDYPNNKLSMKIERLICKIEQLSQELEDLKNPEKKKAEIKEELDNVFTTADKLEGENEQ